MQLCGVQRKTTTAASRVSAAAMWPPSSQVGDNFEHRPFVATPRFQQRLLAHAAAVYVHRVPHSSLVHWGWMSCER